MPIPYSVLMSVYYKEKPEHLRTSMKSMFDQTIPSDDFVLVCDGPLTVGLDAVIEEYQQKYNGILNVVRLQKNGGLGNALREGIKYCKHELIARMDSDDISLPNRCERQLAEFEANPILDILSGTIEEFKESPDFITGKRKLPLSHKEICKFSKKRNPFNHMAVMFRKEAVICAGNYDEKYHFFEDYYLWIRMLRNGCYAKNLEDTLLYVYTPIDMYRRRGGLKYAKDLLRFHCWIRKVGWMTWRDFCTGALVHTVICIMPILIREKVYYRLHK